MCAAAMRCPKCGCLLDNGMESLPLHYLRFHVSLSEFYEHAGALWKMHGDFKELNAVPSRCPWCFVFYDSLDHYDSCAKFLAWWLAC